MGDTIPTFPGAADPKASLLEYILERYRDSEKGDRAFKERALLNWNAFNSKLPAEVRGFNSIYDPQTYIATAGTVEQWMGNVFNREKVFDLEPDGGQDDLQTELMRELMGYVLREKIKYKLTLNYQAMEAALFGNAVMQHDWTEFIVRGRAGMYGAPGEESREMWPRNRVKSRFDLYPARTGATWQEMPYTLTRSLVPLEDLEANAAKAGFDPAAIEKLKAEAFTVDGKDASVIGSNDERLIDLWELLASVGYDVKGSKNAGADGGNHAVKYVEVLLYCEKPALRDGCSWMALVANRLYLLKVMMNPFNHKLKPYSEIKFAPMLGHFWRAWGLPEIVEPIQMMLNIRHNQYSDGLDLANDPMRLIGKDAGIGDLTALARWPGAAIKCGDPNAVKELTRQGASVEILRGLEHLYAQFQRLSGRTDASGGMTGAVTGMDRGADTASGLSLLLQQQSRQVMFKLALAEETGVTDGLQMTAENLGQILTEAVIVRGVKNETLARYGYGRDVSVKPEEIQGPYRFYAVGSTRSMEDPQMAGIIRAWAKEGAAEPEIRARLKLFELFKVVGEMAGIKQTNRFLKSEEEMRQDAINQIQGVLAQLQGRGGAAMGGQPAMMGRAA
ncbi:MAG: hypothetical protein HZC54_00750 [Verrucomicrobia bacterium]|nr:hypothetical protein [Verrucomicrobiota bacterium]